MKNLLILIFLSFSFSLLAQTKVSGLVFDEQGEPVPYANVIFSDSRVGTITNENGKFYLESDDNYSEIQITFVGFVTETIPLIKNVTFDIEVILKTDNEALSEVVIFSGKTSKKKNPSLGSTKPEVEPMIQEEKNNKMPRMRRWWAYDEVSGFKLQF